MNPPRNIRAIEVPVEIPNRTKGMLGGMMMPSTDAVPTRPPARCLLYPCSDMGPMRSPPIAEESATADPEIPPMNMLARTAACPSPPGIHPIRAFAMRTSRLAREP